MVQSEPVVDDVALQYDVPLQPFQILLRHDNKNPMATSDEMKVLNSTQYYLSSRLKDREPGFSNLLLYQFVRDFVDNDHFSKIAMSGIIYFTIPIGATHQRDLQAQIMDSLMGHNLDQYVDVLYSNGMTHIVNATLLSIKGIEMVYWEGRIVENATHLWVEDSQGENEYDEATRDTMDDDDKRKMTTLLCLLIPGIAILMTCTLYVWRSASEINWKQTNQKMTAEVESAWQSREFRVNVGDSKLPTTTRHKASKVGHETADPPAEICT